MYKRINYKDGTIDVIIRESDGASIPVDPKNRDYREFERHLKSTGKRMDDIPKDSRSKDSINAQPI